jgi:protocatechuate 3,4-dioxygenase, alpha subunit
MAQSLTYLRETASQTAGPYVHIGLAPGAAGFHLFETELGTDIVGPNAQGERIRVEGIVYDGTGTPVKDVLIEVWQANAAGIYAHDEDPRSQELEDGFRGWGRIISDFDSGVWTFETVKPGSVPGRAHMGSLRPAAQEEQVDAHGRGHQGLRPMAPHLNLWIVARGINIGLNTRMYFGDEAAANGRDPVLNLIEQSDRRKTLIATREMRDGKPVYRFDLRLQGDGETVFFDI